LIEHFDLGMHKEDGPMRVRENLFYQAIATVGFRIGQTVKEAIALRVFGQVIQVALFLVAKCFTIADEKLKVARVRLIDAWIVNLIDDAVTEREPEAATGMIGRADSFFRARSPAGLDSRRTKRHRILRRTHN